MRSFKIPGSVGGGAVLAATVSISALALSGCMSSPTYGTDKTANEQLLGDVSGMLQLGPKERPNIEYKPRPTLVKPVKGEAENLPQPQDSVATAENPAWPESPEQKRARLRAEADENADDPNWKPQIDSDMARRQTLQTDPKATLTSARGEDRGFVSTQTQRAQSEAFRKKLAEARQGDPNTRKYLSEPPVDYRQVAQSAPVGDVGEDESVKERRLKAAAAKKKDGNWVQNLWPF